MLKALLILFFTIFLSANEPFWLKVNSIKEQFFQNENNITVDENSSNSLIDKKFDAFEELVVMLKKSPYMLENNQSLFFDKSKVDKKVRNLKLRIDTNKKLGYSLAVQRDTIELKDLELRANIVNFFNFIAKNWTKLKPDELKKYILNEHKMLQNRYSIDKFNRLYQSIKNQNSQMANSIKNNYILLKKDYDFFDSFLNYLSINSSILYYESITNKLKLDTLIEYINRLDFAKKLNLFLRYINIDVGRLSLFLIVILFFIFINYLIYKRVYNYFRDKILEVEDETDDILIANLKRIRIPVSLFVNGIGLKLALEILNYPDALSQKVSLYFSIFYIIVSAYILMQLIENLFFVYFYHKGKRDFTLRTELVNLILSIFKVIIFVVAMLLIFVKLSINITGLLASLGIGGLAVALAAQDTLSNFFGLLKIIFDESYSQGDWIKTSDVEGTVVEIGFISTKIRTFDNALITVPNSTLANTSIKNWSKRKIGRRIKLHVGVTYNAKRENLQKAVQEIKEMLLNHKDIIVPQRLDEKSLKKRYINRHKFVSLDDKIGIKSTMLVYFDRFSDSSIDILIYTFTKTTNWQEWLSIKEDVLYKIWEIIEKNDLEFAFPSQSIYFDKQNIKDIDIFDKRP